MSSRAKRKVIWGVHTYFFENHAKTQITANSNLKIIKKTKKINYFIIFNFLYKITTTTNIFTTSIYFKHTFFNNFFTQITYFQPSKTSSLSPATRPLGTKKTSHFFRKITKISIFDARLMDYTVLRSLFLDLQRDRRNFIGQNYSKGPLDEF